MASKINVGDKFIIKGLENSPVYICVSVEPSSLGFDWVWLRAVGSLFVSVRFTSDDFVNGLVEKL